MVDLLVTQWLQKFCHDDRLGLVTGTGTAPGNFIDIGIAISHGAIRQDRASIVNIALWADLVLQSGLDVGEFDT